MRRQKHSALSHGQTECSITFYQLDCRVEELDQITRVGVFGHCNASKGMDDSGLLICLQKTPTDEKVRSDPKILPKPAWRLLVKQICKLTKSKAKV